MSQERPEHIDWIFITRVVFMLLILAILFAHAEHSDSTQLLKDYTGKDRGSCCGTLDCIEATVSLLHLDDQRATVQIGIHEVSLPASWVHPSPGTTGYWCFTPQSTERRILGEGDHRHVRAIPPEVPTPANTRCVFYMSNW